MSNRPPKILIISRAFRAGDGITISNLFSKFNKASLFGLFQLYDPNMVDMFANYHIIKDEYEVKQIMGIGIAGEYNQKQPKINNREPKSNSFHLILNKIRLFVKRIGLNALKYFDLYETRYKINCTPELEQWINKIQPDIIYTSLGDLPIANFVDEIHHKFPDIKIALHCFDDWPQPSYTILYRKRHIWRSEEALKNIISYSTFRFTSSEKMARDYEKRYGSKFICFPNPIEVRRFLTEESPKFENASSEILFLGKIGRHNEEAIKDMMNAVEQYNITHKSGLTFKIYTGVDRNQLELLIGKIQKHTVICKSIPNCEIPGIIKRSSVLFLPISINKEVSLFAKYSMSTKMGEYLASGRPVLFCGASEIAMSEFLTEKECAVIVNKRGVLPIFQGIVKCLGHDEEIKEQISRGINIAANYFDKESVASKFKDSLSGKLL